MPKSIIGLFHDDYAHSPVLEIFRLQNYYQVLGVEPTASFEVIKKAYRRHLRRDCICRGSSTVKELRKRLEQV